MIIPPAVLHIGFFSNTVIFIFYICTFLSFLVKFKCNIDPPILILVIFYALYFTSNVLVWIVMYNNFGIFKGTSGGVDLESQELINPIFIMVEDIMIFVIVMFIQYFIYEMLLVKIVFDCQSHSTYESLMNRAQKQRYFVLSSLSSLLIIGIIAEIVKLAVPSQSPIACNIVMTTSLSFGIVI